MRALVVFTLGEDRTRAHAPRERERERDPNKRMVVGVVFFRSQKSFVGF